MAMTTVDERLLVEAHKSGDRRAFDEIVREYRPELEAYALRRLGDARAAEDAVQETFLRAFRALPRFNGAYHLRAWLYRILTNVCYDEGARRVREAVLVERARAVVDRDAPGPEDVVDHDPARHQRVSAAMASLPDSYRVALEQRYAEDRSYREIADSSGISEENARARVHRGAAALKRLLGGAVAGIGALLPFPFLRRSGERAAWADTAGSSAAGSAPQVDATVQAAASALPTLGNAAAAASAAAPILSTKAGAIAVAAGAIATVAVPVAATRVADDASPARDAATVVSDALPEGGTTAPLPSDPTAATVSVGAPTTGGAPSTTVAVPAGDATTAPGTAAAGAPGTEAPPAATDPTPAKPTPSTTVAGEATAPVPAKDPTGATPSSTVVPPVPTAPEAGPGTVAASGLATAPAGARMELTGAVTIDAAGTTHAGTLAGKVAVGDPAAPPVDGATADLDATLGITLDDGTYVEVRLAAPVVVTVRADGTLVVPLDGVAYRVGGGEPLGLLGQGTAAGTLTLAPAGGASALQLSLA